jgi:hypothetical protein
MTFLRKQRGQAHLPDLEVIKLSLESKSMTLLETSRILHCASVSATFFAGAGFFFTYLSYQAR